MVIMPLHPNEITPENLVTIYGLFCKAYEIDLSERAEFFMRSQGTKCLQSNFGLDYMPYIGGKFYGQRCGNSTEFHGYSDLNDAQHETKTGKFEELIFENFNFLFQ